MTGRDIRDAIREAGFTIERRQIVLDQPLKEIGSYNIRVVLHPDVSRMVRVMVARSAEEAERTAKAAAKAAAKVAAEVAVEPEAAEA